MQHKFFNKRIKFTNPSNKSNTTSKKVLFNLIIIPNNPKRLEILRSRKYQFNKKDYFDILSLMQTQQKIFPQ